MSFSLRSRPYLSQWITVLLPAVPRRSRKTFIELLCACLVSPEGWVTRAIGSISRRCHWTTYYKLIERGSVRYLLRIPIEGKFGQGKNGYRLNYIRAKCANTSFAWINTICLVMNLLVLQRIFFVLRQCRLVGLLQLIVRAWEQRAWNLRINFNLVGLTCSSLPRLIY